MSEDTGSCSPSSTSPSLSIKSNETSSSEQLDQTMNNLTLKPLSRKLLILYAGETGNSEDLAKRIGWQAKSRGFEIVACPFDDYQIGKLVKEDFVLFICSTTNQGDEPSNMRKFWTFIMRKGLPKDVLSNVRCAVIGLGDSSYLRYNTVGKKLYKCLKGLGARMMMGICLGDDQHDLGLDAAVDKWLPEYWNEMEKFFKKSYANKSSSSPNNTTSLNQQSFKLYDVQIVEKKDNTPSTVPTHEFATNNTSKPTDNISTSLSKKTRDDQMVVYNHENYFRSKVLSNVRMTSADHFQDTRLAKFYLCQDNKSLLYSPGDVAMILPQNSKENVDEFVKLFKLDRNQRVKIKRLNKQFLGFNLYDTIANKPMTIEQLVSQYFDLTAVPKRSFFEVLSTYAMDKLEREKLKEFASTAGQYALYEYCKKPKRNLLEVLVDFPKTAAILKFKDLVQLINPIFPRPYSIASSLLECPRELHVLVAVKQVKTLLKKPRLGLCSNYIKRLKENDEVFFYVRKITIDLPPEKIPLIMIGPGTGVAPFRAMIQDRISKGQPSNFLFFGCRNRAKDYYFEEEWSQANARGLLYIFVAFSRDQPKKCYVQDKMWEHRKLLWELVSQCDAHIIVCGSSSQMPKDVRQMLIKILKDQGGKELQENNKAETVVDRFEANKKLQFELWD